MLYSQFNATLFSENASFDFKLNVQTLALCVCQELNNVKSILMFVYKTCSMINSQSVFEALSA